MSRIVLDSVRKRFGDVVAVDGVSLGVEDGEFLTLLGDSGCGKTTVLRMIAGFTAPDGGRILRDGEDITHVAPKDRRMGFVFQSYALFPTQTVAENIGFALRIAGTSAASIGARVGELARMVELDALLDRYPHELSGGQQQRVALARALAPKPSVLLLDEPLSALDARIRGKLRGELRALVDRLGVTAIYVTHDQEEALALSTRVAVMRRGRIEQVGTPDEIYLRPRSRFVAEFVGSANIVAGRVAEGGVDAPAQFWPARIPPQATRGTPALVVYRPEHLAIASAEDADFHGRIEAVTFLGPNVRLRVALPNGPDLVVDCSSARAPGTLRVGTDIALRADREHAVVLTDAVA